MEYKIVTESDYFNHMERGTFTKAVSKLENEVNELIKYGWKPQGGIMTMDGGNYCHLFQAMFKE